MCYLNGLASVSSQGMISKWLPVMSMQQNSLVLVGEFAQFAEWHCQVDFEYVIANVECGSCICVMSLLLLLLGVLQVLTSIVS